MAEWRRACGGSNGAPYPYGGAYMAGNCNDKNGGVDALEPTGTRTECATGEEIYDMVGNVFEWTAEKRIVGGSFNSDEGVASCSYSSGKSPSSSAGDIGFRCCASPN